MEKTRVLTIVIIILIAGFFVFGKDFVTGFINQNKGSEIKLEEPEVKEKFIPKPEESKNIEKPKDSGSNDEQEIQQEQPDATDRSSGSAIDNSQTKSQPTIIHIDVPLKVGSATISAGTSSVANLEN